MRAIIREEYGSPDVLKFSEVEKPSPGDDEVLIKVHAASLNALDWRMMRAKPFFIRLGFGLTKPKNKLLGADVAGRVEAVGRNVKRFQSGDEVFGDVFQTGLGSFAEYVCANQDLLALKPAKSTYEEAAAAPVAGYTALQGLRNLGKIQSGQKVMIHGASGGVGTFAVQIAKSYGAEITAVCSTRNVDMVRALGADRVIDYKQEDFTKNGQLYDLIFVANGSRSIFDYRRALSPKGIYVCAGGAMSQFFQVMILGPLLSKLGSRKFYLCSAKPNIEDLEAIKELLEAGKVKPVIDKCYPLAEVADAIRYMEDVHAQGKVVITV